MIMNEKHKDSVNVASDSEPTAQRRTYQRPELTEYGNVREFTRGPGGTKADAKIGAQN